MAAATAVGLHVAQPEAVLLVVVWAVRDENNAGRGRIGGDGQGALQQDLANERMRVHCPREPESCRTEDPVEVTQTRRPGQVWLEPEDVAEVADDGAVGGDTGGSLRSPSPPAFQAIQCGLNRPWVRHPEGDLRRTPLIEAARQLLDICVPDVGGGMVCVPGMGVGTVRQQQEGSGQRWVG